MQKNGMTEYSFTSLESYINVKVLVKRSAAPPART